MQKNTAEDTRSLDLKKQSETQKNQVTSESLPKSVSMHLLNLMHKVVETDVNPESVKAACQCASEIHKMIKLNIELQKKGF